MNKPVVHYMDLADWAVQVGQSCYLRPIDHPSPRVSNMGSWVRTSPVIAFNLETGIIETKNTIYKKVENA